MIEAGDENENPLLLVALPKRPGHREGFGDGFEAVAQCHEIERRGSRVEDDPHEEIAGLGVVELLRVENVAAALEKAGRDFGDDAGAVGAGKGEDVARAGHVEFAFLTRRAGSASKSPINGGKRDAAVKRNPFCGRLR